jgi:hypothetical protein
MGHHLKVAFLSVTLNPTWVPVVLGASRSLTFIAFTHPPRGHNDFLSCPKVPLSKSTKKFLFHSTKIKDMALIFAKRDANGNSYCGIFKDLSVSLAPSSPSISSSPPPPPPPLLLLLLLLLLLHGFTK